MEPHAEPVDCIEGAASQILADNGIYLVRHRLEEVRWTCRLAGPTPIDICCALLQSRAALEL